jgi:hypothetical protein
MTANAYLEALAHFNECDAEVSRAVDILGVGNQLQNNRAYFSFSHTQSDLPPEASLSRRSASFTANNWPDVPKLMGMLSRWHKAWAGVQSAWSNVPDNLKAGLKPPPADAVKDVVR